MLGTVESSDGRQLVVADVPGLIEGASEGIGLGHEFLAHLERARLLVHVIDSSEGDADERWHTIDAELAAYGAGLDERRQIVVLNKIDLSPEPPAFGVEDERIERVLRLSAATGAGLDDLRRALFELAPPEEEPDAAEPADEMVDFLVYKPARSGGGTASSAPRAASASPASLRPRPSSRRSSKQPVRGPATRSSWARTCSRGSTSCTAARSTRRISVTSRLRTPRASTLASSSS